MIAAVDVDWELVTLYLVTFIISTTVHEAAHALFAKLGGDPTAYRGGQVSLNPWPHIRREPFGMVLFPLISLYASSGDSCIGFASTPIDPFWAYRHPRRAALMSAAGPLANMLLAAIAFGVLAAVSHPESGTGEAVSRIARAFLGLNVLLCLFNLVPLPPLDGAGVVQGLVPQLRPLYDALRSQQITAFIALLVGIKVVPLVYWPLMHWLEHALARR